ncbi:FAD-dependent oxidoreductase [Marinobacter sp. S6332]|uniref:NAD(P)/FAD-dependent oxidoreductase n=1 Tax=Marinobacter sp. S6332 TaxID=2926403 RepID=UPI001FF3A674|nr:FAD-dependent oxidoreductase [Marinobacter sp. S6332]
MTKKICVIGAGIVGISVALKLSQQGHQVTVLDREGVASEASQGNAGAFAFTDVLPLASPGIMRNAPKWLLDPLGPLSVSPKYALQIAPWLFRFWRASWPDRHEASLQAQTQLMALAKAALERQIADNKAEHMIRREGQLQLYQGESSYKASLPAWELRRERGIRFELLESPGAIADIQPGLDSSFTHAGYTPDWMNATDPKAWTDFLAERFLASGGRIDIRQVESLEGTESGARIQCQDGDVVCDHVVVCAGAWSHRLAATVGDRLPLETERGYNTTLPDHELDLRTHLTFQDHGFVVSKVAQGVRVGGAVEFGGLTLPPNYKRAEALLKKAQVFIPKLKVSGGQQWMGFRPSLPDSLPIIDCSPKAPNIFYAFGHGHLGLTQSAATAELISDLISGEAPSISMKPYAASRFV